MTRAETCQRIEAIGIVPVVRLSNPRLVLPATEALIAGGVAVVEITMTVPGAVAHMREVAARFHDHVLVGAGTVTSAEQARAAVQAGARFIVSPGFDAEIVREAHALDAPCIAGVLTPTEIMAALRAGADWLKIFPCSALGGAKYLRSLRGPFPHAPMIPTGGVNLATAGEYLAAGAVALGVGTELVDEAALGAGHFADLRDRAQAFIAAVRSARSPRTVSDTNNSAGHDPGAATRTPPQGV